MTAKNLLFAITFILGVFSLINRANTCLSCMSNGVQCLNATSFHMCYGANRDQVDTTTTLSCEIGYVCTGLGIICAPESDVDPACNAASTGCGLCTASAFTCTSKTTFALCVGGSMTGTKGKCPDDFICDASSTSAEICVHRCKGQATCSLETPVA